MEYTIYPGQRETARTGFLDSTCRWSWEYFSAANTLAVARHEHKACLVMDSEAYRYQKFISDIAGQDVKPHKNDPKAAVFQVRDWLRTKSQRVDIPDGQVIWGRFSQFQRRLPGICHRLKWNQEILKLKFVDYRYVIHDWLADNPL